MFWRVRVGPLNLHKALGANRLITAPGCVEIGRVVKKADWTFARILVQEDLDGLTVDCCIFGELKLSRAHVCLGIVLRRCGQ
jgi:hypothetical protein